MEPSSQAGCEDRHQPVLRLHHHPHHSGQLCVTGPADLQLDRHCGVSKYGAMQCNAMQCNAMQCNAM